MCLTKTHIPPLVVVHFLCYFRIWTPISKQDVGSYQGKPFFFTDPQKNKRKNICVLTKLVEAISFFSIFVTKLAVGVHSLKNSKPSNLSHFPGVVLMGHICHHVKNQHPKMFRWWCVIIVQSRFCLASDSTS